MIDGPRNKQENAADDDLNQWKKENKIQDKDERGLLTREEEMMTIVIQRQDDRRRQRQRGEKGNRGLKPDD